MQLKKKSASNSLKKYYHLHDEPEVCNLQLVFWVSAQSGVNSRYLFDLLNQARQAGNTSVRDNAVYLATSTSFKTQACVCGPKQYV